MVYGCSNWDLNQANGLGLADHSSSLIAATHTPNRALASKRECPRHGAFSRQVHVLRASKTAVVLTTAVVLLKSLHCVVVTETTPPPAPKRKVRKKKAKPVEKTPMWKVPGA